MRARSTVRDALALLVALLTPVTTPAHEFVATVTLAEGEGVLISGAHGYVPAAGVRLRHCDIIQTGPKALVQVEIDDGGMIELGHETRFLADLPQRSGAESVVGPQYVLAGWVKVTVPKRTEGAAHVLDTPFFELAINAGIAVLQVTAEGARFFVESGEASVLDRSADPSARVAVRAGQMYSRKDREPKGELAARPAPAFVKAMPAAFRDTLPPRLAKLKARVLEAKPGPRYRPQDVADWRKSEVEIRPCVAR